MTGAPTVPPLHGNQMHAVAPNETVWLSASAGTGKTQVLSSRVLRLLLQEHVEPSQILCLTFTKAGATEMAARINDKLAKWVRLDDVRLTEELRAIGADYRPAARARARTLFAQVLDCPGGGLRIDTIHAFAQWLLGAFPHEAELTPGTRPMEDRDRILLARQVLADLLTAAERDSLGDPQLLSALADLSLRMGPEDVEAYLLRCAEARDAWFGPGAWQEPMRPRINQLLGLEADADASHVAALCGDDLFDVVALRRCLDVNRSWQAKTGQEAAGKIEAWLAGSPEQRVAALDALHLVFFTKDGKPRATTSLDKLDPDYASYVADVGECIAVARALASLLTLADRLVPALRLGRAFALAWDAAKTREGLIDFDDQIRRAAALLGQSAMAEWIRYKLDRRFDHILVDEAQDTNAAQWRIIFALTEEFWAGIGARDAAMRTLFVVGDYKQAIFRFQGTSPENFREAAERVKRLMDGRAEALDAADLGEEAKRLLELGLDRSFRTAQPVLDFVDRAIGEIGHAAFGLNDAPDRHEGEARPGYVALWRPIGQRAEALDDDEDYAVGGEADEGEEGWLSRPDRQLAERIAQQIKHWMDPQGPGFPLVKGGARRAGPGDVMVLVRRRRELAGLIVARLHAAGVPVAGVDRLRLGAPLAVRDLVAALRFAAQPFDDLNLAALLVSPLLGWTQDDLLARGYRDRGVRLWAHLRQVRDPVVERLNDVLARADYQAPQALLHWLLVGPWQGRRALVARLGREANDPIDELLNAASAYAAGATASLVGFLAWFDAGEGELKREAGSGGDLVRVMTVHGSKGLQAPIVILADAAGNPASGRGLRLDLPEVHTPERVIPLPSLKKEDRVGRIAEEHARIERAEMQEHWRLLYVAMTRAEEALLIGGALGMREKEPAEDSWYARLRRLFGPGDWIDDPIWSTRLEWGALAPPIAPDTKPAQFPLIAPLPTWTQCLPPAEPRPPRPLAPSSLGEDLSADPPHPAGGARSAARRGVLVHKLLERLPETPEAERRAVGARWLAKNAAGLDEAARDAILASALAVLSHSDWCDLFAPGGLAEVPIAAVVGGQVVSGAIDRLLVEPDRIRLVDFKTARRPPADLSEVPLATLRQLAAYAAALAAAYPGRAIEAAVLYTATPQLIVLPAALLAEHKRALLATE
jgi:ATP-dependent helicase/nuclease subunit A